MNSAWSLGCNLSYLNSTSICNYIASLASSPPFDCTSSMQPF